MVEVGSLPVVIPAWPGTDNMKVRHTSSHAFSRMLFPARLHISHDLHYRVSYYDYSYIELGGCFKLSAMCRVLPSPS